MRLTEMSPRGGCACKLPRAALGGVLESIPQTGTARSRSRDLLRIGLDQPDDAAVFASDKNRSWVFTTDFQTPIVDDPYDWGRIAATNALSDVYAMGGRPLFALNLLAWSEALPEESLAAVLAGGADAVGAAGGLVVGGHTIADDVPKYGLAVVGEVSDDCVLTKGGCQPGDELVLTKALGVGVVGTAIKRGAAPRALVDAAVALMTRLNQHATDVAGRAGLKGGTDVTGFGLIGHLREMCSAAGLVGTIDVSAVPVLRADDADVLDLIAAGMAPDGSRRTLADAESAGWFRGDSVREDRRLLLADAQTSGGLLLSVPPRQSRDLVLSLRDEGDTEAAVIGQLTLPRPGVPAGTVVAKEAV